MKLSVVIPAHNEEGSIAETLTTLYDKLQLLSMHQTRSALYYL